LRVDRCRNMDELNTTRLLLMFTKSVS